MLGSPCSPCCNQCVADIVPSQALISSGGGMLYGVSRPSAMPSAILEPYQTSVGLGSQVVMTRNDTVAPYGGIGWSFEGGFDDVFAFTIPVTPPAGGGGVIHANASARIAYVRATLWVYQASNNPSGPQYDGDGNRICWLWGATLQESYLGRLTPRDEGGDLGGYFVPDVRVEYTSGMASSSPARPTGELAAIYPYAGDDIYAPAPAVHRSPYHFMPSGLFQYGTATALLRFAAQFVSYDESPAGSGSYAGWAPQQNAPSAAFSILLGGGGTPWFP